VGGLFVLIILDDDEIKGICKFRTEKFLAQGLSPIGIE
jgi:hypothetical protein